MNNPPYKKRFEELPPFPELFKQIKEATGIDCVLLKDVPKPDKFYIHDNLISFDEVEGAHKAFTYGKHREQNKRLHAYLKSRKFDVIWLRVYGGHKVSVIKTSPEKYYKDFGNA